MTMMRIQTVTKCVPFNFPNPIRDFPQKKAIYLTCEEQSIHAKSNSVMRRGIHSCEEQSIHAKHIFFKLNNQIE